MLLKIRSTDCTLIEVILQGKIRLYLKDEATFRRMEYALMKRKSCADFIILSGRLIKGMKGAWHMLFKF